MARLILENVTMEYPPLRRSLAHAAVNLTRKKAPASFALRDLNLTLEDGDRLALLGPNGAGKTTLLSILAGIYQPLEGRVIREGSLETLFSVSAGVDRELPGEANIDLHLKRLGVTGKAADAARTYIRDLSELGDALNNPVHTYSAGMGTRLAFAMAMAIDPEILLIDEYFGAGDQAFQRKARAVMLDKLEQSRIVVFASHNPRLLESLCNKALVLEKGQVVAQGAIEEVLPPYLETLKAEPRASRRSALDKAAPAAALPLTVARTQRAVSLDIDSGGDTPSAACLSAAGAGDAAFFAMAEALAGAGGLTYADAPSMFAEQGVNANARVTGIRKQPPETGVLLGGIRGWPSFQAPLLETGRVAVMVRDPRELAAETWLIDSGLNDAGLDETLNELDDQLPSRLPGAIARVRGLYEGLAAGGAFSREHVQLFRMEAALADPEGAAAALAAHLGIAPGEDALKQAAAAFADHAVIASPLAALRSSEQGQIRMAFNRLARELGYETPEPA